MLCRKRTGRWKDKSMIQREDILSMEYLKKTEFTGCHQGMRYRLEQTTDPEDPEGGKIGRASCRERV